MVKKSGGLWQCLVFLVNYILVAGPLETIFRFFVRKQPSGADLTYVTSFEKKQQQCKDPQVNSTTTALLPHSHLRDVETKKWLLHCTFTTTGTSNRANDAYRTLRNILNIRLTNHTRFFSTYLVLYRSERWVIKLFYAWYKRLIRRKWV
ncbi:hypothetical protein TNCV_3177971 [Trichonephila clavipes]|nr:hypothetical protein TNCV_3177971 [Trichonephila clavipes]